MAESDSWYHSMTMGKSSPAPSAKVQHGQFYTLRSPFDHPLFREWVAKIPKIKKKSFIEPFGGANNIIELSQSQLPGVSLSQWRSYDLHPEAISVNKVPEVPLIANDSILNPPQGDVCITNPPYLAKNSAKRMGYTVEFGGYGDLWELSIAKNLAAVDYLAAIIPESFLTRGLFHERLMGVISITESLFDDTGFPVCLALWLKKPQDDFEVYVGDRRIGSYSEISERNPLSGITLDSDLKARYNDPLGELGLRAVDSPKGASIRYVRGEEIPSEQIKISSRAITRISLSRKSGADPLNGMSLDELISELNRAVEGYREATSDIFLTNFKSLREDGVYRRRLDWKTSDRFIHQLLGRSSASLFATSR